MKKILLCCVLSLLTFSTQAAETIKIGEISEYKLWAPMAVNQRRGFALALEEINGSGGVLGRPLELISRDGGDGTPEQALRDAEELSQKEGVKLLLGTGPDNVGLAVSSFAKKNHIFFLKGINGTNRHIWEEGHKYAFRFDVPNYMYGNVFADAVAKLPVKRWAVIGPDYEFGHSVWADFQKSLKERNPDVEFVGEQWHPIGKIQAGAVVAAVKRLNPDGIFVANFGPDTVQLIREGNKRGLFKGKTVIGVLTAQPEQLEPMGKEAPVGWISQGYPYAMVDTPEHKKFLEAYKAKFNDTPGWFSFVGYNSLKHLAAAIAKAGSTDPDKVAAAMEGLEVDALVGPVTYRKSDHQSNLGLWVGTIGFGKDGKPTLLNPQYKSGDLYYPGDAYVKKVRPQ